jgi:hypothetical protein
MKSSKCPCSDVEISLNIGKHGIVFGKLVTTKPIVFIKEPLFIHTTCKECGKESSTLCFGGYIKSDVSFMSQGDSEVD